MIRLEKVGETPGSWRVRHDRIPTELAAKLFDKAPELGEKDPSPVRIARRLSASHGLSLSPGTIRHWLVGDRKPERRIERNVFRNEPSRALSYVIGANIGDGCTLTANWIVKIEVTDYDFAETFNSCMTKLFKRRTPNRILVRYEVGRLPMYIVKYSSKQLVHLLRLPMKKIVAIACVFPRDFLRGFFDAEGYVGVGAGEHFSLVVGADNSEKSLLSDTRRSLELLGIESRINRKRKAGSIKVIRDNTFKTRRTSYNLMIAKIEDVKKFAKMVGFSIRRKAQKHQDALAIIATVSSRGRVAAWEELYLKAGGEWIKRKPLSFQSKSI